MNDEEINAFLNLVPIGEKTKFRFYIKNKNSDGTVINRPLIVSKINYASKEHVDTEHNLISFFLEEQKNEN